MAGRLAGWLLAGAERDDVIGEDQKRVWRGNVHKAKACVGLTGIRGCGGAAAAG